MNNSILILHIQNATFQKRDSGTLVFFRNFYEFFQPYKTPA